MREAHLRVRPQTAHQQQLLLGLRGTKWPRSSPKREPSACQPPPLFVTATKPRREAVAPAFVNRHAERHEELGLIQVLHGRGLWAPPGQPADASLASSRSRGVPLVKPERRFSS